VPADGWSAKDIVCHFRDIEELALTRFHMMLVMEDPKVFVVGAPPADLAAWGIGGDVPVPLDADRWAIDRQYAVSDAHAAFRAFARRRRELLAFLAALTPDQWERGSIHPTFGRWTYEPWTAGIAAHDDNHLAQLRSALSP
jgi:hypothetical protein